MCLGNCINVSVVEQESLMVMQLPTNQYWFVSVWWWSVSAASVSQHQWSNVLSQGKSDSLDPEG